MGERGGLCRTKLAFMALTDAERRVCNIISGRRDALLDDLRLHVGIPTGGNNRTALDETRERLCSRLSRLGASVELVPGDPKPEWLHGVEPGGYTPPTAVCRRDRDVEGARAIMLSGHLDTVHDPDGPFRELNIAPDGKTATGPGCVDMKGGLVIAVAALEALEEAGVRIPWSFALNSDEETGSYCSERALRAEAARLLEHARATGQQDPVALVLEPATPEGGLVIERAGSGQFLFEARGRSAHVGRDFSSGISAVTALAKCILDVPSLVDVERGLIANVGPLEGSCATNVVPDLARAWGNVRFPNKEGAEWLARALEMIAARHTSETGLPSVEVKSSFVRAAKPLTEGTQRLAERARAAAADLGQNLPFTKTNGVCDGNILQDAGLACIDTLGVRGGGLHTPQEWIELASLVERSQLLAVLMMRLARGE